MANRQNPNEEVPTGGGGGNGDGNGDNEQQEQGRGRGGGAIPQFSFEFVSHGPQGVQTRRQVSLGFGGGTQSTQPQPEVTHDHIDMGNVFGAVQQMMQQMGAHNTEQNTPAGTAGNGQNNGPQQQQQRQQVPDMLNMLQSMFSSLTSGAGISGEDINDIAARLFEQQERQHHPTSRTFLESLEEKELTEEDIRRNPSDAITFEEFNVGDKAVKLPCGHAFYKHGLMEWLKDNNNCPVCRERLPEEEEGNRQTRHRQHQQQDDESLLHSVLNDTFGGAGSSSSSASGSAATNSQEATSGSDESEDIAMLVRQSLTDLSDNDLRQQCERENIRLPPNPSRISMIHALVRLIAYAESPSNIDVCQQEQTTETQGASFADGGPSSSTGHRTFSIHDFLSNNPVNEEPVADSSVYTIKIRVPSANQTLSRKFSPSAKIRDVVAYAVSQNPDHFSVDPQSGHPQCVVRTFPERTTYDLWDTKLEECFNDKRVQVVIEKT